MHIEFLVEEFSMEEVLKVLVPRIVPDVEFTIHQFGGKQALLTNLLARLKAYVGWLPDDWRLVVLVDRDNDECVALKGHLEKAALDAGLPTARTTKEQALVRVFNRIAIEELEAWFFGDPSAIARAYARVSPHLGKQAKYRDPDAITGGTWEALERVLQKAGHYKTGLAKIEAARNIAAQMDPDQNSSRSFQVFRDTLRLLSLTTS